MNARQTVADFWDAVVTDFYAGSISPEREQVLGLWRVSYGGRGRGAVDLEACPEPYLGPLAPAVGEPRLVVLGLNPGQSNLAFQGRGGLFESEIREKAFSGWAVTEPYLREPWRSAHPPNKYHLDRLTFARRWTGDSSVRSRDVLMLEMYPWHSTAVTAAMRPDPKLIDRFVWQPIAEIDVEVAFAFGRDWAAVAEGLRLLEERVSAHFATPARRMRVFGLPSGQRLAVVWQAGYAGPPGNADVEAMRAALGSSAGKPPPYVPSPEGAAQQASVCLHELDIGTCAICTTRSPARKQVLGAGTVSSSLAEALRPSLTRLGFGEPRVQTSFIASKWPPGHWYAGHTQNGDVHIAVRPDSVEFRVHIDTVHGDRPANESAFDRLRQAVEPVLLDRLPADASVDWRAARGGNNQVCAIRGGAGASGSDAAGDAAWLGEVAGAWLLALREPVDLHPQQ